jgi:D-alanyl-D-alanine carboxypeptidase
MILLAAISLALVSESPIDTSAIDAALAKAFHATAPGATVVVVKNGEVVFRRSYGLANLETSVPLAPEMPLPIGSVTKPFTAAAVLTLVRDGKLGLDTPLRTLVPELTAAGAVTVDQLLTHTSGIKSFTDLPEWQEETARDPAKGVEAARVMSMIAAQALDFAPGSQQAYSNSNYFLLGKIVAAVSGKPYEEYLRTSVLKPAGMTHTFCASPQTIAPVLGYRKRGGPFTPEPFLGPPGCRGGGGLAATAEDVARWNRVLSTDVVLPARIRQAMVTPVGPVPEAAAYARGFEVWNHRGHRYLWHGGYTWGFVSALVHDMDENTTVALLSNNVSPVEELDAPYLAKRVALMAGGGDGAEPTAVPVPADVLSRYAGHYTNAAGDQRKVVFRGGTLFAQRVPGPRYEIFGEKPSRFFFKNSFTRFTFVTDATGKTTRMLEEGEGAPQTWERTGDLPARSPIDVPADALATLVGEYEIRPGHILAVTREGAQLFGQPTGGTREPFLASTPMDFFIESADTEFTFLTDAAGKVTAVRLHEPGWQLEARRIR